MRQGWLRATMAEPRSRRLSTTTALSSSFPALRHGLSCFLPNKRNYYRGQCSVSGNARNDHG